MKTIIQQMVDKYNPQNNQKRKSTIKEVMQEIVLYSLRKTNFFNEVAFYDGTVLRIFYDLDRFSEYLDFALLSKNPHFNLSKYFPLLEINPTRLTTYETKFRLQSISYSVKLYDEVSLFAGNYTLLFVEVEKIILKAGVHITMFFI